MERMREGGEAMRLTAEQVRKAVNSHGNIMDNRFYCDWQAIADELNAVLGCMKCEQILVDCEDGLLPPFTAYCSVCGAEWGFTPKFCHNCGAKVMGTVQVADVKSGRWMMSGICDICKRSECAERQDEAWHCDKYLRHESNYTRLFGTPERTTRTLKKLIEDGPFLIKEDRDSFKSAKACDLLDELCGGCGKCPSCVNVHETEYSIKFECNGGDYDALLEWLRSDAE